jgi:hypothetical protein
MKQIKAITAAKHCYIVPGKAGDYDIQLSIQLSVPILTGEPLTTKVFSTKSGAKKLFNELQIPTPIGTCNIRSNADFYGQLTKLIADNLFINTWIFKMDTEYNGRGHASLQVDQIKTIVELRKTKVDMTRPIMNKL